MGEMVDLELTYEVTVNNPDAVDRCLTSEWQAKFYKFAAREAVLKYLALYVGAYGIEVNRLDGWADLAADAVIAAER